jgi:quercetin dioxygenase-like cupin family protein
MTENPKNGTRNVDTVRVLPRFAGAGAELALTPKQSFTVKVSTEETQGACAIIEITAEPGEGVPPHLHHREDESFCIMAGQLSVTVEGVTTVLNPGEYGFLPRGIVHSWQAVGEETVRFILVVTPGGMDKMFAEMNELVCDIEPAEIQMETVVPHWLEIVARYGIEFTA